MLFGELSARSGQETACACLARMGRHAAKYARGMASHLFDIEVGHG